MFAIMTVLQFPPSESLRRRVSFESLCQIHRETHTDTLSQTSEWFCLKLYTQIKTQTQREGICPCYGPLSTPHLPLSDPIKLLPPSCHMIACLSTYL